METNFSYGMTPLISKPTRVTATTATLIDNFFTNSVGMDPIIGIIPIEISDHYPICYVVPKITETSKADPISKRKFTVPNMEKFKKLLEDSNWDEVMHEQDTQAAYNLFHNKFTKAFEKSFPYKKTTKMAAKEIPWLTEGMKKSIITKHKLYAAQIKHPTQHTIKVYKEFKNKLTHLIRKEERKYYHDKIETNKQNLRQTWKYINQAINRRKKVKVKTKFIKIGANRSDNNKDIADQFNKFFTHVGTSLDSKIPTTNINPISFIKKNYENTMFLTPCHNTEISKIIDQLKICATGWDEVPSTIIKDNKPILTSIIVHIINLSLTQGHFPEQLKIANIIPIFKAGDLEEVGNYRPVSLLTVFSKIFERVFYERLKSFLKIQKILFELQFGFREAHSTYMAITILMDKIIKALEKGHYVIGVFLDFSKAFDTVNHNILLKKLNHYGIRGVANKWIASYLENRKQFCTFNTQSSKMETITCGVPQGSILGPLLFLIYINDLGTISEKLTSILFADDSNLFAEGSNLKNLQDVVNSEIPTLVNWLQSNRLSLNIKKTHVMVFGRLSEEAKKQVAVNINGQILDVVVNTKFLGLMLDDSSNWKAHVKYITQKLAKSIGILSQARKVFDRKTLIQLYYSFIYPYINYCNLSWGNAQDSTLWPIYRLQKVAIRIVFNIKSRNSSRVECNKFKILRLPEVHLLNIGIFMHKYKSESLPPIFNDFFDENRISHNYMTRNASKLRVPKVRTTLADRYIRKTGVKFWNNIEENLDTATTLCTFKKLLKTYLVKDY